MVAGVGEILWDVIGDAERLGGAPVNFAYYVNSLGATGIPVSTIGDDDRGWHALEVLSQKGLSTDAVSLDLAHPTGYVMANVDDQGVAHYRFPDETAWDYLHINGFARSIADKLSAVCFGTLAQRSTMAKRSIREFIHWIPDKTLVVYDMNLRQDFYNRRLMEESLILCNVLKLNDAELQVVAQMFGISNKECEALSVLVEKFSLQLAIVTKGKNGSLMISPKNKAEHPGYPTKVIDTIGAGDAFTAAATLGLLQNHDLADISEYANRFAAHVCSHKGAMPMISMDMKIDQGN